MVDQELEKILKEIHYIKQIISKDSILLQKFLESIGIRFLALLFGIGIFIISIIAYYYNKLIQISPYFIWILGICIIIIFIIGGIIKWKTWNFIFPDNPWPNLFFKIIGIPILKIVLLVVSIILIFTIGLLIFRLYHYILFVWALGVGVAYFIYGSLFNIIILELIGYYFIVNGCISLLFIYNKPNNAWLWSAIIFGIGFILYFIFSTFISLMRKD